MTLPPEYSVIILLLLAAHTPDNTFLGFVVDVDMNKKEPIKTKSGRKPIGVVYGKDAKFWKVF